MVSAARHPTGRGHLHRHAAAALGAESRRVERTPAALAVGHGTATAGAERSHPGQSADAVGHVDQPVVLDCCGKDANRHAEVGQHLEVLVGRAAEGGQVVPDDEGVDAGRHADGL